MIGRGIFSYRMSAEGNRCSPKNVHELLTKIKRDRRRRMFFVTKLLSISIKVFTTARCCSADMGDHVVLSGLPGARSISI